jgi:hypothetical protein
MQFHIPGLSPRIDRSFTQNEAAPEAPMSAARLAAETAFSVSRNSSPEQLPTITVRRSRGFGGAAANAETVPDAEHAALAASANKGPRIFRLGPSTPQLTDAPAIEPAVAPAAGSSFTEAEEIPAIRRKRRVAAVQRPGPVVQIFKAAVDDRAEDGRDTTGVHGETVTRAQVAVLAEMLASVQSILEDVQRARAFRVLDPDAGPPRAA